jgi:hypothetical protein
MSALTDKLEELGFTADKEALDTHEQNAAAFGMSDNGAYAVHGVHTKGDVIVHTEQNTAPEDLGGLSAIVTHPTVAVMVSPKGRVAFNPEHVEIVEHLVKELS